MVDFARPKFRLDRTVGTPGALRVIERAGPSRAEFLDRHICGDWGNLSADDRALNDEAVQNGSRICSAYRTRSGTKILVIAEAADDNGQRAVTTILLPDEY